MVSLMPGRITPGKEPRKELIRRLGGPQSRSRDFGDEKNLFDMDMPYTRVLHIKVAYRVLHK
jgi:hypothetical protein